MSVDLSRLSARPLFSETYYLKVLAKYIATKKNNPRIIFPDIIGGRLFELMKNFAFLGLQDISWANIL